MIKHIFSDMDGTLLNSTGRISSVNIKRINDSQIPFTLVSARAPMEMTEVIDKLHLNSPQIAFNGGLIFKKNKDDLEILADDPLDIGIVKKIINYITINFKDISCSCYYSNNWYSEKIDDGTRYETLLTGQIPKIVNYANLFTEGINIYKIMLIDFGKLKLKTLEQKLNSLNLNVSIKQTGLNYLEITNVKAKKSRGIKYIQDLENISKDEMAAFGDGHNDLPMFASVGTPIVMENALDEIKAYGKFITQTNDENGVAFGIEKYLEVN